MNIDNLATDHKHKKVIVVCPNPAIDIYAHLDTMQPQLPNRFLKEERYPGGKGIHVAMALAEVGIHVTVVGFWGGITGQWIQEECNKYYPSIAFSGIDLQEWSRLCYTMLSNDDFDHTEYLGTGPTINIALETEFIDTIKSTLTEADAVVCSGSWPAGSSDTGYQQIIELGKAQGLATFIDCTGNQLEHALASKPHGIHLNRHEVTTFCKNDDFDFCKKEILKTCTQAYITDGKNGLYLCSKEGEHHTRIVLDKIISTVGSGDCLLAGVVAGHVFELTNADVAKLGAAFGSSNCVRNDLGMLFKADIERLFDRVKSKTQEYAV